MATRALTSLLADPERRVLRFLAARLPSLIRSDHLTALGVLGATGAGVAYALSARHPAWLWAASALLAINWLGDSLDGTLARVRHLERPRYGYYLDHFVDAFSTTVIGVGVGLSPYVDLGVALGVVVLYLILSINVYLETNVFGVFELGYGRIGPTEARLLLIGCNTLLALLGPGAGALAGRLANAALGAVLVGMGVVLLARFGRNLSRLGRLEPDLGRRRT